MGAVGRGGVDVPDQGDATQDLSLAVPLVRSAVNESERHAPAGSLAEQDERGHGEALVHLAGELGIAGSGVCARAQLHRHEQEALGGTGVEPPRAFKQAGLSRVPDLVIAKLKQDASRHCFGLEVLGGLCVPLVYPERLGEVRHAARLAREGAVATETETAQQPERGRVERQARAFGQRIAEGGSGHGVHASLPGSESTIASHVTNS